jgi:HKD family nuclease
MDHKLNIEDLQESLQTSFICKKHDSSEKYRSKFLINSGQFSAGNIQKVICDILDELRGCESFDISVAYHGRRSKSTHPNALGTQRKRYKRSNSHHRLQPLF